MSGMYCKGAKNKQETANILINHLMVENIWLNEVPNSFSF